MRTLGGFIPLVREGYFVTVAEQDTCHLVLKQDGLVGSEYRERYKGSTGILDSFTTR